MKIRDVQGYKIAEIELERNENGYQILHWDGYGNLVNVERCGKDFQTAKWNKDLYIKHFKQDCVEV